MDVYLPADFHALHDDVVTDWRDLSSGVRDGSIALSDATQPAKQDNQDVDPNWLAI